MVLSDKKKCLNYKGFCPISHKRIANMRGYNLVIMSDRNCYDTKSIADWIRTLLRRGLRLGHPNFFLPTRSPITEDDLNKLLIELEEENEVGEIEIPRDMYGPLNVWNIRRNNERNPGGLLSNYDRFGNLLTNEQLQRNEDLGQANNYIMIVEAFLDSQVDENELHNFGILDDDNNLRELDTLYNNPENIDDYVRVLHNRLRQRLDRGSDGKRKSYKKKSNRKSSKKKSSKRKSKKKSPKRRIVYI